MKKILALFFFSIVLSGCVSSGTENTNYDTTNNNDVEAKSANLNNNTSSLVNENIEIEELNVEANQEFQEVEGLKPDKSEQIFDYYNVVRVVDGDTIRVNINGSEEVVRLIGIDTPETVDPRKTVECFGREASDKAKELLNNKKVRLESDPSQNDRDVYKRLLRYVYLEGGLFFNEWMIKNGYAYEYTYVIPYKYQSEFKAAQKYAENNKLGLWADGVCDNLNNIKNETVAPIIEEKKDTIAPVVEEIQNCLIKGNINSKKEKIYHLPGCASYKATVITESAGERWFCTEQEALNAGWRKALNCP